MKKILLIQITLLLSTICFAADTAFYEKGKIKSIYKRGKYYESYYETGKMKEYNRSDSFFRKGKTITYDSLGNIESKGRTVFDVRKQGRWEEYENGKKHIVHYKYGIEKSTLRTPNGKRVKCILTYGKGAPWNSYLCDSALEKYRVRYVAVAGCVVNNKILSKTAFHNFFIYVRKSVRFGIHWEDKMAAMCPDKKRF
ncbi:MAG: hypothetical protein ACXVPU_00890 [Bacteroidia bacterium]